MTSTAADIMASSTSQQDAASGVIAGAAPAVVGVLRGERYSARREAEILGLYAQGWPIPPDVRRKLRPKHFRRTKEDVLEEARRR